MDDLTYTLRQLCQGNRDGSHAVQAAFGLRMEEAVKFQPRYVDHGDHIAIKGSLAKGRRDRTVSITTPEQRAVLDEAHHLVGLESLISSHKAHISNGMKC